MIPGYVEHTSGRKDYKMLDREPNQTNSIQSSQDTQATQAPSTYRWSYADQCAFEQKEKRKRRGTVVYALIMAAVFLVCFALLAQVLIWEDASSSLAGNQNTNSTSNKTVGEISDAVTPTTVLIYAYNGTAYSYGTGFFFRSNGYIATNYHVVKGATSLEVATQAGKVLKADLVGYRDAEDLAVLKVLGNDFPVPTIGDSNDVCVGDSAVVIGNPAGADAAWTTTAGIISALDRVVMVNGGHYIAELKLIQTDAAVNQGNSGGPLCDGNGKVVGIISRGYTEYSGIGFAIPINDAMVILNAIADVGSADRVSVSFARVRPTMGVTGATIQKGETFRLQNVTYTAQTNGVLVQKTDESFSAGAILQVGDLIYAVDGKTVSNINELTELLYDYEIGAEVTVSIWRQGTQKELRIRLGCYA